MSFIKNVVGPDEKLIGIVSLHWIYAAKGFAWLGAFLVIGFITRHFFFVLFDGDLAPFRAWGDLALWLCGVAGSVMAFFYFLMWMTAEIGLTTKRVIYKRGFIFVDVKEADLEEIKAADVDNGFLGTLLDYGYIFLDSRFVENINLPALRRPYVFVKALNEARSRLKQGSMRFILEDAHQPDDRDVSDAVDRAQQPRTPPGTHTETPPEPSPETNERPPIVTDLPMSPSRPVLFASSLQKKQEFLRQKIKRAFKRKTTAN